VVKVGDGIEVSLCGRSVVLANVLQVSELDKWRWISGSLFS
ncbi:hypothetical protein A2U01_0110617, partial [Trifolium medium]|nr:hypothetical protein [Trifolium medium]